MPTLTIIRGLSGSGKSRLANSLFQTHFVQTGQKLSHYEADDYFVQPDGSYLFNPADLGKAHTLCQINTFSDMTKGFDVVVSNTFSRKWEMGIYVAWARFFAYRVKVIDLFDAGLTDTELAARCQHDVPVERIALMRSKWER